MVADTKMVEYHGQPHVESYMLTIMNMVRLRPAVGKGDKAGCRARAHGHSCRARSRHTLGGLSPSRATVLALWPGSPVGLLGKTGSFNLSPGHLFSTFFKMRSCAGNN